MAEVPDHQRASVVKTLSDGSDVEQRAGAVVDMRQHGHRDFPINQGVDRTIAADQSSLHRAAGRLHGALDDVEIRRERSILGDDHVAIRPQADGRLDRLVEIDRRGVANQRLTRGRPDQRPDAVTEPDRHVEPSGAVPAPDQVMAPFLFDCPAENAGRGSRHRTERISVEIDDAFRNDKTVAQVAKRICGVPFNASGACYMGDGRHHERLAIKFRRRPGSSSSLC